MRFKIRASSGLMRVYVDRLANFGYNSSDEFKGSVNIESLEDLHKLMRVVGNDLVLKLDEDEGTFEIEIYDDYRE